MKSYAFTIENGQVKLYDADTGQFQRFVGSDAVNAQIAGNLVMVFTKKHRTEIYDANTGMFKRFL